MAEPASPRDLQPSAGSLRRAKSLFAALVLGALFALAGLLAVSLWNRQSLPTLTRDRFQQAQQRWQAHGPASYDIEIQVSGRQPATYQVQVRQGVVRQAWRNGRPLRQQRTLGTWSVPGMFGTIATDLTNVQKVLDGTADRSTPRLSLRAAFNEQFGYPERYHRTEKVQMGATNPEVSWQVVNFSVIDARPE